MNKKIFFLSILISFLDLLTTFMNMFLYRTCLLERNPILVFLCTHNPLHIFLRMPIEAMVIYIITVALKYLRMRMNVKFHIVYIFLALCLAPAVNNLIWIIRFFLLLHSQGF